MVSAPCFTTFCRLSIVRKAVGGDFTQPTTTIFCHEIGFCGLDDHRNQAGRLTVEFVCA